MTDLDNIAVIGGVDYYEFMLDLGERVALFGDIQPDRANTWNQGVIGRTLAAANENDRFEPASLTKVMTAYVTLRAIREGRLTFDTTIKVSTAAAAQQ